MSVALRLLDTKRTSTVADVVEARKRGLTVQLDAVEKSFGDRRVLEPLNLAFAPGEFVAVVGRSGGGKSTLLRLLAGLEKPTAGRILLDGETFAGPAPSVRMLFQDARLLPWQRVLQNVGIGRAPGWRERAHNALRDVGLGDRGDDWPAVLSGGQRQRVALARALVSSPHLLLLDEPFGALDALTRREMHALLLRLWHRDHFTTLLITHDVAEAVTLADRVLVLKDGRIVLDADVGTPRPREPDDHRVAALERDVLAAV